MTIQQLSVLFLLGGASFLAATILPFSSEAALSAAIIADISPWWALLFASIGNCLACLFNYFIGKRGVEAWQKKRGDLPPMLQKARDLLSKHPLTALLLSWTPILGDPLTIALGMAHTSLRLFVPIVFGLRVARYWIILLLLA